MPLFSWCGIRVLMVLGPFELEKFKHCGRAQLEGLSSPLLDLVCNSKTDTLHTILKGGSSILEHSLTGELLDNVDFSNVSSGGEFRQDWDANRRSSGPFVALNCSHDSHVGWRCLVDPTSPAAPFTQALSAFHRGSGQDA